MFVVYIATNKTNGKRYVGATSRGLSVRKYQHLSDAKRGKKNGCRVFNAAIRKYGEDAFEWTILSTVGSCEELMIEEIRLIDELKPEYNITKGGRGIIGVPRTPEWRANMSKGMMGRVSPRYWLGKRQSDETIEKMKKTKRALNPGKVEGKLTQDRVRQIMFYDPISGDFTRLVSCNQHVNRVTGVVEKKTGYVRIKIDGKRYMAHQLAWLYVHGEWLRVGHKNHNHSDNRLVNLRPVTPSQVCASKKSSNSLGVKGVGLHESGKYVARIMFNRKSIYLGLFDTIEEASTAYKNKAMELYGEFARAA